ncbi:MAG: sulfatase-like hydrolase/transferase [Verrucomicrobiota bacterium]
MKSTFSVLFLILSLLPPGLGADKPNVLFILVDDMNWRLGCYGSELAHTPNLDRLAKRGVRFDRAYCNFPVCGPSRTSLLSGRFPESTGVFGNGVDPRTVLGEDYRFLPEYFRDHGYYTAGVGKIPHTPEHLDSMVWDFHRDPQWQPEAVFHGIVPKDTLDWPEENHPDGISTRLAIEMLETKRDQPLFLTVGFHRPHAPRAAPQHYWDLIDPNTLPIPKPGTLTRGIPAVAIPPKFEPEYPEPKIRSTLHAYHATAAFIDAQVGLLMKTMDENDLWDSTIVVFTSDHGVYLGEHGGFWTKMTLMEEAMKVPLLVHLPGGASGETSSAPVGLVDIFPTLTDACGLPTQEGIEGESLVSLVKDPKSTREKDATWGTVIRREGKIQRFGHSVRTRKWAYSEWPDGSKQLYHHAKDPGELENLVDDPEHHEIQERLVSKLEKHRKRLAGTDVRREDPEKPNIVIILADDLGYEDLGIQGSSEVRTPHLDSLATNGVRCSEAYISAPVCSPSRAGILTGRYQNRFGFEFLASKDATVEPGQLVGLPPQEITIAERMKELGYVTGCVGKWHVGDQEAQYPTNQGFDEFYGTLGQSGYFEPMLFDSRNSTKPKKVKTPGYYVTEDYSRRAVEFVQEHQNEPFFLYLPHFAVHKPHVATDRYLERFHEEVDPIRRTYLAMLSAMDDGVGLLLEALRETGLEEETLIFFLSDNGGTQGSSNLPLRGRKGGTWEGGIRTPFLIQWKSRLPAGEVFSKPVISLDLFPTCIAAGGGTVKQASQLDGVNLLPWLNGKRDDSPHKSLFWRFGTQWAIRHGDWKLVQAREGKTGSIQIAETGPVRLFDLSNDLAETNDLATALPEKVAELQQFWDTWAEQLPKPKWLPPPVPGG